MNQKSSELRRELSIGLIGGVWVLVYFISSLLLDKYKFASWLGVILALLPLPAFLFWVYYVFRQIQGMDEMKQRIYLEAGSIAFVLTVVLVFALGFFERFAVLSPDAWSYGDLWMWLAMFLFIGLALSWRRYR